MLLELWITKVIFLVLSWISEIFNRVESQNASYKKQKGTEVPPHLYDINKQCHQKFHDNQLIIR